jgi:mycofactocin precursor
MEQQPNFDKIQVEEPMIVEDVVIETLAIDGICGVY